MPALSVVINTKNAAATLEATLKSVKSIAEEIVVVDMESTDGTEKIAKKYTSHVFALEKDYHFVEPARNFAIEKTTGEWILIIDADEELGAELSQEIAQIVAGKGSAESYFISRQNIVFGKWIEHAGWWPDYQLRLFKKGAVVWSDKIHSVPQTHQKPAFLPAKKEFALIHHNYPTVELFLEKLDRYTTVESQQVEEKQTRVTSATLIHAFSREFFARCFKHRGIEDGIHGVSLSYMQAMYELVKQLKIWEKSGAAPTHDAKESISALRTFNRDLKYWLADWECQHSSGLTHLYWQIRRRLMI
jgi:glycosyltransferase involved in cell wall biosynthesis